MLRHWCCSFFFIVNYPASIWHLKIINEAIILIHFSSMFPFYPLPPNFQGGVKREQWPKWINQLNVLNCSRLIDINHLVHLVRTQSFPKNQQFLPPDTQTNVFGKFCKRTKWMIPIVMTADINRRRSGVAIVNFKQIQDNIR